MDIQDKTKEQLIAELLNLQEQNSKLKSQLDSIADLKNAEDLLLNSESEIKNKFSTLSSIFESTQNIIIFSLDTNYCYTAFTNLHKKTMKLIWGVDIALGMNMLELIQLPADRKKAKDNFDKVLSGEYLRFEEEYGDSKLHRAYYEDIYNPIVDNKGVVVGLSVFVIDITDRKNAETENERTHKLLEESQRIGKIGGWELDIDTMELFWTSEMYAIHEVDSTFKPKLDKRQNFFTPESLIAIEDAVKRTIKLGEPYDIDVEINTAKGNRKNIRTIGKLDLDKRRVFGYFQDITERKKAEEAMRIMLTKYQVLFDIFPIGITLSDANGKVIECNNIADQILGIKGEEHIKRKINSQEWRIIRPDGSDMPTSEYASVRALELGIQVANVEMGIVKDNNEVTWINVTAVPIPLDGYGVAIIYNDITNNKIIQSALKESEEKYRFIIDNAIEGMYRTSIDGKALMANRSLANTLGYASVEEYLNEMNDSAHQVWVNPEQRAEYISILDKHDIIQGYECQMKKKDGTPIWVSLNAKIVRDEAGNKIYSEGFTEEITTRKNAESELKRQNQLFDSLIKNLSVGVFMVDAPSGKPLIANKSALDLLGRGILPDVSKQNLAEVYKACKFDTNQPYPVDEMPIVKGMYGEYSHIDDMIVERPDGTKTHLEIFGSPVKDDEGNVWASLVSFEDITKRKQVEHALKYSKQQYEHLFEFSGASMIILDIEGKYLMVNKTSAQHFGLPASEIVGKSIFDFFPSELALKYYNQNKFLIETDGHNEYEDSFELNGKLNTFYIIDQCLKDENGKNYALLSSSINITERKLAEEELKSSREQLRNFSSHLLKVRENERADITLEIHDSVAQFLVALKVEMGLYLKKMSSGIDVVKTEEVKTKMEQLVSKVDITLKSARMIMNGLRPDQLELLGLVDAVEVHLHNFEEIHHIKCNFENTVTEPITHQEQSIVLFRILQESLTNILKHANANAVKVKLTKFESNLMLEVIDNGVGFDEKCIFKPDSYGVISMREQVKRLDGVFSIKSQIGQGTLVHVEIPCSA